jgi:hypothetical protein
MEIFCNFVVFCVGLCSKFLSVCRGGALFFTVPPAASTYKRVGKTCQIFLPNWEFTGTQLKRTLA